MNITVIGRGSWGQNIARTLREHDFNVEVFGKDGWREAVERNTNGVVIATPPSTHFGIAKFCIERNKPTFIEKPLTLDVVEAKTLLELAVKTNVLSMVDHIYLWHDEYLDMKYRINNESIHTIHSMGGNNGPVRVDHSSLWDYGPHDLSMVLDLLGESPISVRSERENANEGEVWRLHLRFPSEATAHVCVGNGFLQRKRQIVVQTKSLIHTFYDTRKARPLDRALLEFTNKITNKVFDVSGLVLGIKIVEILDLASRIKSNENVP